MATEKPELKLQEVQQPMMVEQRQETIGGIGYTQRPINARTQTRNRYLDGVKAVLGFKVIPAYIPTQIDGLTYTKTGNYDFTHGNDDRIFIPESGTYLLIFSANRETEASTLGIVLVSDSDSVLGSIASLQYFNYINTFNLTKGDYIYFEVINNGAGDVPLDNINISLIKLS